MIEADKLAFDVYGLGEVAQEALRADSIGLNGFGDTPQFRAHAEWRRTQSSNQTAVDAHDTKQNWPARHVGLELFTSGGIRASKIIALQRKISLPVRRGQYSAQSDNRTPRNPRHIKIVHQTRMVQPIKRGMAQLR